MTIDVYTATGTKKGTLTLSSLLFEAPINEGLMHQALLRQQGNRRPPVAHVKSRGEIQGSTRKLFSQKGTGRARRGSVRSPLLRGGSKAFGPRKNANFKKDMPRTMRRRALASCLSLQAKRGSIIGLEQYAGTSKTKEVMTLLTKLPVAIGRRILFVTAQGNQQLALSARNIPHVKVIRAQYLNPEDVLGAWYIIFLVDALKVAEETFGKQESKNPSTSLPSTSLRAGRTGQKPETKEHAKVTTKKAPASSTKKTSSPKPKP